MTRLIALIALLSACGAAPAPTAATAPGAAPATTEPAAAGSVRNVDVSDFAAERDAGKVAFLLDVRTPDEFAEGHVPGATLLPVQELGQRMAELESHKGEEIHVICRSGSRSAKASAMLAAAGYQAVNIEGGTLAWQAAGQPVE